MALTTGKHEGYLHFGTITGKGTPDLSFQTMCLQIGSHLYVYGYAWVSMYTCIHL